MKRLRIRSGAVKSARYRAILIVISGAVLLQIPSWLGHMALTELSVLANGGRAKVGSGTSSAFQMGEDHYLRIPYFIESEGMDSTLTLNNNMPQAMAASVTLFSKAGEALSLPPMSLHPTSPIRLSLGELSKGGRGDFSSGNIEIFFHGPSMGVTSQVSVISAAKRLAFESVESEGMDFSSSKLDGIVWFPDEETRGSLALTNTTTGDLSIVGKTNQTEGSETKTFTLGAHETRLVDLRESFGIKGAGVSALVSLEHTGSPGALIVTGFATNVATGFSTNLVFWDRSTLKTTHLAGAHVRFGKAAAGEGFAPGTTFRAPLVVGNAGSAPTKANLFVDYTARTRIGRLALGQISLAPGALKQIDLSTEMDRRGVAGPVDDAGIDIDYGAPPGSVIARLVCFDQTGDLSFDVPVKDPLAGVMGSDSGTYPWRLDGAFTTIVRLKNYTAKPVYGIVQVRYEGGTYNPERIRMAPYQTVSVDIKELRDSQQPDIRGGVLPRDTESGQVVWFEEDVGSLVGRAEVANIPAGIASSFSCLSGCQCPPNYTTSYLTPSSAASFLGDTCQFIANETRTDCNGFNYGPYNRTSDSVWSSNNTSVASVSSSGVASCLSVGGTSIVARFTATTYGANCNPITFSPGPSTPMTVYRLQLSVPDSTVPSESGNTFAAVVAGESFTMIVNAVDQNGNVLTSVNATASVTSNRVLDSSESGLPASFTLQSGTYTAGGRLLNRVSGQDRGTTFRVAVGSGTVDFFLYTYFRVDCTREGLVGQPTACGHTVQPNDHFVALPVSGLCNVQVVVRNPNGWQSDSIPKLDQGPWFPGPNSYCDPTGSIGGDPYWNTGTRPRVETTGCGLNNAAIDLADGTFATCGNPSRVVWRFGP